MPAMAAMTYPHGIRRHISTPPNVSPGAISDKSSAATSLKASVSTGGDRPAKMYAAHSDPHRCQPESNEHQRTANESHWGHWTKTPGHSPRVDMRESEDEHGRCQNKRSDVPRKERIESGTKEVEGISCTVVYQILNFADFLSPGPKPAPVFGFPPMLADLDADGWRFRLTAVEQIKEILQRLKETGGYAFTHLGLLERRDGASFQAAAADELLKQSRTWSESLQSARNAVEHEGWTLPPVRYVRVGDKIKATEPANRGKASNGICGFSFRPPCLLRRRRNGTSAEAQTASVYNVVGDSPRRTFGRCAGTIPTNAGPGRHSTVGRLVSRFIL